MMSPEVIAPEFGWFSIALGLFTLLYRLIHPAFFRKLAMMQKAFGAGPGYLMHFLAYTVVPLVVGASMVWAHYNGQLAH